MTEINRKVTSRRGRKKIWDERRATKALRDKLIKAMLKQGLTDEAIAEATGVSKKTIYRRRVGK